MRMKVVEKLKALKAVKALKAADGDIVIAIMDLTN